MLSHTSTKEHYETGACIVWCFDARFSGLYDLFAKYIHNPDLIKIAGGANDLTEKGPDAYVLDQIAKSIKLHRPKEILLMMHEECGACDGNTKTSFYESKLAKAKEVVQKNYPGIPTRIFYATFDGIIEK
ncbi:MAG: hypothetical protein O2794_01670 [bacterium]|nr:hypothetical protein [bacterium]